MGFLRCTLIARVGCLCSGCFFSLVHLFFQCFPPHLWLGFKNPDFLWISFSTMNHSFFVPRLSSCYTQVLLNQTLNKSFHFAEPSNPTTHDTWDMSNSWAFPGYCKGEKKKRFLAFISLKYDKFVITYQNSNFKFLLSLL